MNLGSPITLTGFTLHCTKNPLLLAFCRYGSLDKNGKVNGDKGVKVFDFTLAFS